MQDSCSQITETVTTQTGSIACAITIAIPTYRYNPTRLITALAACEQSEKAHLIIYDDGSNELTLKEHLSSAIENWNGTATLILADQNGGRSHARNRLLDHSSTDWILFLDADMLPDDSTFLSAYFAAIEKAGQPALIAGGFSLKQVVPDKSQELHAAQSRASECISAADRAQTPGRYVFTSNILAHRDIFLAVTFDDGFSGWGWEDTDWGLRVAKNFPVVHIENTATHLGLDSNEALLEKYGSSGPNFARMVQRNPIEAETMALTIAAKKLAKIPGRSLVRNLSKLAAKSALPPSLRLKALKLYRAASYAEHFK